MLSNVQMQLHSRELGQAQHMSEVKVCLNSKKILLVHKQVHLDHGSA